MVNSTGEDLEEIRRLWIYGDNVEVRRLEFDQGHTYEDLASYLTKEPRGGGHPQVGERTWTPSLGLARTEPETETVPDYVTLTAPPEAVILQNEGPVRNGYGEFAWIKYMLPYQPDRRRARSKRRRRRKKRIGFSILFGLGGKYILFDFSEKGAKRFAIEHALW